MKEGSTFCPYCGEKQKVNNVKKTVDVEQKNIQFESMFQNMDNTGEMATKNDAVEKRKRGWKDIFLGISIVLLGVVFFKCFNISYRYSYADHVSDIRRQWQDHLLVLAVVESVLLLPIINSIWMLVFNGKYNKSTVTISVFSNIVAYFIFEIGLKHMYSVLNEFMLTSFTILWFFACLSGTIAAILFGRDCKLRLQLSEKQKKVVFASFLYC